MQKNNLRFFLLLAEKSFLNRIKLNLICVVITLFRLILHQVEFCLMSIQSKKLNNNHYLVEFNKTQESLYPGVDYSYTQ